VWLDHSQLYELSDPSAPSSYVQWSAAVPAPESGQDPERKNMEGGDRRIPWGESMSPARERRSKTEPP